MPTADLGDIQIYFQERGEGPPLLGIMGLALDQRFWAGQIPAVTETHRFITFDNRAIGRSSGPVVHTVDEMAADTVRLLDHLGIESCVVMGISMGGTIAQRLTLDHPDRVSALVLALTWARPIEFMRRQHALGRMLLTQLGEDSFNAFVDGSMIRMFTPEFFEAGRETIDGLLRFFYLNQDGVPMNPEVVLAQLDACDKHDTLAELPAISCPTLVVGGKVDQMVPGLASPEIAAAIPGARLEMLESGHGATVEEMDRFNGLLSEFLRSL